MTIEKSPAYEGSHSKRKCAHAVQAQHNCLQGTVESDESPNNASKGMCTMRAFRSRSTITFWRSSIASTAPASSVPAERQSKRKPTHLASPMKANHHFPLASRSPSTLLMNHSDAPNALIVINPCIQNKPHTSTWAPAPRPDEEPDTGRVLLSQPL